MADIRCGVIYYGMIRNPEIRTDLPLLIVEMNAPLTYVNLPNAHHSFDLVDENDQSRAVIADTLAFLKRHLN